MTRATVALLLALIAAPLAAAEVASSPTTIRPLLLGSAIPDTTLSDLDGAKVALRDATKGRYSALVFYRGGWCPYCNVQLQDLRKIRGELDALGYTLVSITPDRPEKLRETVTKNELDYTLLSDTGGATSRGFGIAYRVDADTTQKLSGYGIDLDAASGDSHHTLPVPAVFLVDREGIVRFACVDPDYTRRAPAEVILAAAKAVKTQSDRVKP